MLLAFTPFAYIRNLYMRKGEVYADSFAASYGYSAELVSGLEKLNVYMYQDKNAENTFLAPFYDLMMLEADIINTLSGGHGSTQQRSLRMVDKLDKDLEQSNLNAADKAAIKKEKERLLATYGKFMNCDEQVRGVLTEPRALPYYLSVVLQSFSISSNQLVLQVLFTAIRDYGVDISPQKVIHLRLAFTH